MPRTLSTNSRSVDGLKVSLRCGCSAARRQRTQDAAVTRGLNATISEGLEIESEQFARMVPTLDIREALDASMSQTALRTVGRW